MSVNWKLLEWPCPRHHWEGVAEDITFENGVPWFVRGYWFLWSCHEFCWYWKLNRKKIINKNKLINIEVYFASLKSPRLIIISNYCFHFPNGFIKENIVIGLIIFLISNLRQRLKGIVFLCQRRTQEQAGNKLKSTKFGVLVAELSGDMFSEIHILGIYLSQLY